jgi:hypothetical protein
MIRGTTPELTFNLPFDISTIKSLYVTFTDRDGNAVLEKAKADCTLSGKTVKVKLTQAETLNFKGRQSVQIQLRVLTNDGEALASTIYTVNVAEILKDGVIE